MSVLLAILALERLEAIVCPLVNRQCPRYSEGLATARDIADIWLYSVGEILAKCRRQKEKGKVRTLLGMPPHMLLQRGCFREILAAGLALERSVPRMRLHVPCDFLFA